MTKKKTCVHTKVVDYLFFPVRNVSEFISHSITILSPVQKKGMAMKDPMEVKPIASII